MDKIHWTKLGRGYKTFKPHILMLRPSGYVETIKCRLKGESYSTEPEEREVTFDENYLIDRVKTPLSELLVLPKDEFLKLMEKVYDRK